MEKETPVPVQTCIQMLPHEVLWSIFTINADMFSNPGALTDTKDASQVCRTWREILVDRPSIWGKLIDLNILNQVSVSDDWANEVLRRSQGSLLWIQGAVIGDAEKPAPSWTFFASLLFNHWSRIQRFVVDVDPVDEDDPTWEAMSQPAPHLEVFQVHLHNLNEEDELIFSPAWKAYKGFPLDLFSNSAPVLRQFHTDHLSVSPSAAPWLSKLCSMSLTSPFNHEQVCQVLQHTPLLEHLTLKNLLSYSEDLPLPQLTLSHLSELVITDFIEYLNRILAHITPAPGCSLTLSAHEISGLPLPLEILSETAQSFSKYIKNFYQTHTATHIAMHCFRDYFYFIDCNHPSGALCDIRFEFGPESLGLKTSLSTAFATLLSAFTASPTQFHSVGTLNLQLNAGPAINFSYFSLLSTLIFPVVKVLDTWEDSLSQFLQKNGHSPVASSSQSFPLSFPTLKVLKIRRIKEPQSPKSAHASPLILFLNTRRHEGYPIKVLELDLSRNYEKLGSLRHYGPILDQEAVGMTVEVLCEEGGEVRKAVCGGDNVTRLFR